MTTVDLSSSLGESYGRWTIGNDEEMLREISSAHVATGFHAGDPRTLLDTCRRAAEQAIPVGALVAYNDIAGFGRRFIATNPAALLAEVTYQIGALQALARAAGTKVSYVRPHGSLYHSVARYEAHAKAVISAIRDYDTSLAVVGLPGSVFLREAEAVGLRTVAEGIADRAYLPDGTLAPRDHPGALISNINVATERVVRMLTQHTVEATDGSVIELAPETIYIQGDTDHSVTLARAVRSRLESSGVEIAPFISTPS